MVAQGYGNIAPGRLCEVVGAIAAAGVLLAGAVVAQLIASLTDRRSRREEGPRMDKKAVIVSSIMIVVSNVMVAVALAIASTGSRRIRL